MSDPSDVFDWNNALNPLLALTPADCVALPAQRLPAGEGRECLVQWRAADRYSHERWLLTMTERPAVGSTDTAPPQSLEVNIDLNQRQTDLRWHNADPSFTARMQRQADRIASTTAAQMADARQALHQLSGVDKIRQHWALAYLPHVVIIVGLTAFAYMFSIVHIK
jgi:hypothetical protein